MAISLVCSPKFVISDDATSGLDVTVQAQVLDLLRTLVREHDTSMLFITRDVGITAHFCDRVAVIYRGEIVEFAKTTDFFENPQHPYSVMLLAAFAPTRRSGTLAQAPGLDEARQAGPASPAPLRARRRRVDERHPTCATRHPTRTLPLPVERVA